MFVLAQPANPYLEQGRELAEQLRFPEAIARLEVAKQVPGLDTAGRVEVLELLGRCQVADGRRAAAEETFTELLRTEPTFSWGKASVSPKILSVFTAAKTKLYPQDYVALEEQSAPVGRVLLKLVDPWSRVSKVEIRARRDAGAWMTQTFEQSGTELSFPVVVPVGSVFEWFAVARSESGAVVADVGSAAKPRRIENLRVDVRPGTAPEVTRPTRIAGWITVGVAVAAAGVGAGLQANSWSLRSAARDPSRPPGDWADTALKAEADGLAQARWARGLFISAGAAGAVGLALLVW